LFITDPPHGDRIPYLELSEIWNVILREEPPFESEIVVSNAKERSKKSLGYNQATHPGSAHKDELLACSVLLALHPVPIGRREPTPADLATAARQLFSLRTG